jgi:adenylate kinase
MAPSRRAILDLTARWRLAVAARSSPTTTTTTTIPPAASSAIARALGGPGALLASWPQAAAPTRAASTSASSSACAGAAAPQQPPPPPAPVPPPAPSQARWVFLGPPGVGKGTYASRVAAALGVAHVAAGDLVRAEIKAGSPLGLQAREAVAAGRLLPDALVLALVRARLAALGPRGGYLLDGFPRTRAQAEALFSEVAGAGRDGAGTPALPSLAVNLSLREEVLVDKCVGRRVCGRCGKGFNVADIRLAASADGAQPEIVMPPLSPPDECAAHMETREDDTEPVVRRRLAAYRAEAGPVEAFFAGRAMLLDFEITGGIPQTLPRLARALAPYHGGGEELISGGGRGGEAGPVDKNARDKAKCGLAAAAAGGGAAAGSQPRREQACG